MLIFYAYKLKITYQSKRMTNVDFIQILTLPLTYTLRRLS